MTSFPGASSIKIQLGRRLLAHAEERETIPTTSLSKGREVSVSFTKWETRKNRRPTQKIFQKPHVRAEQRIPYSRQSQSYKHLHLNVVFTTVVAFITKSCPQENKTRIISRGTLDPFISSVIFGNSLTFTKPWICYCLESESSFRTGRDFSSFSSFSLPTERSRNQSQVLRRVVWFGSEGTLKLLQFQPLCCG